MLQELIFPIHFFDYEAVGTAVPRITGTEPHRQIPIQYSLHILHEDGRLEHFEYLSDTLALPETLVQTMKKHFLDIGSVVSWHKSYEGGQNRWMAELYPEHREFLLDINKRTFDLEDCFKEPYVDVAFCGSSSIKKVLPVLCPTFSYADLTIQDGTQAMEQWLRMVSEQTPKADAEKIREDLLAYCKLDTLAMVEIMKVLRKEVALE